MIAVATLLTFMRGVPQGLVNSWDDGRFLVEFDPVQAINLENLRAIWAESHFEAYHPLHLMAYWIDVPLTYEAGVGPSGPVIHGVNLLLWVGALLLLWRVMLALGLPRWSALVATLFCGLHPAQVEAVTWATGRKEILAMLFASMMWLAHLRAQGTMDRWAWASRGFYILGALAKTTIMPLPVLIFLGDIWLRDRPWRKALSVSLPTLGLGIAVAWWVVSLWTQNEMIRPTLEGFGRIELMAATFSHYLGTAALPYQNSPIYPLYRSASEIGVFAWWGVMLWVVLAISLWRRPRARFALAAFPLLLAPVLNFVPVFFGVQDRYLSLPMIVIGFGAGAMTAAASRRFGSRMAVFAMAIVAMYALRCADYQGRWSDERTLWRHATATHPTAFYAWMKLGEVERARGDWSGAIEAYDRGIEAQPEIRLGYANRLSVVCMRDEERHDLPPRAVELSARFLGAASDPETLRELASEMVRAGYQEAALVPLARSLELAPVPRARLERAAEVQVEQGNDWLADFYRRWAETAE